MSPSAYSSRFSESEARIRAALAAKREGRPLAQTPKAPKSARKRVRELLPEPPDVPFATVRIRPDATFLEKCVVVILRRSGFGNHRKADSSRVEVVSDTRRLKLTKTLLDSTELADVSSLDGEVDDDMGRACVPAPFFRSGAVYAIPLAAVPRVEARLRQFADLRRTLVTRFVDAYPDRVRESAAALGELDNLRDYPSSDGLADQFAFTWEYVEFGVPGNLRRVDEALFDEAVRKAETSACPLRTGASGAADRRGARRFRVAASRGVHESRLVSAKWRFPCTATWRREPAHGCGGRMRARSGATTALSRVEGPRCAAAPATPRHRCQTGQ